jgi:cytochrome c1
MRNIKRTSFSLVSLLSLLSLAALWVCGGTVAMAASGGVHLEPAGNDVNNIKSLQEGARNFMNYCSGCHSAQYVRYNTIARDLDLSDDQVADNLMFNADKMFETIVASMPADDAKRWFGQPAVMLFLRPPQQRDYRRGLFAFRVFFDLRIGPFVVGG